MLFLQQYICSVKGIYHAGVMTDLTVAPIFGLEGNVTVTYSLGC
jgi:hypothetical protein